MIVRITPSIAHGTVTVPPSKSDAHRLLICAGLAAGDSMVHGVAPSEDMAATMDCLRALGARIAYADGTAQIRGIGGVFPQDAVLPCRECGSTLRFMIPIVLLGGGRYTFSGSETLLSRPLSVYEDLFQKQGVCMIRENGRLTAAGSILAGDYALSGSISSQFISGLCFALPLLPRDSRITVIPPLESRPYIDMTLRALQRFGVRAAWTGEFQIGIPGGQTYFPQTVSAEGDCSNAAFLDALNLLGGDVTLAGLPAHTLQGDRVYTQYFNALRQGTPSLDLRDCPDLGPVCMAMAAVMHGAVFTGTRRLRIKESDRCAAMAEELAKFGIDTQVQEDRMTVLGGTLHAPDVPLSGHNDHRIVMALSLLCTRMGGMIEGAQAVRKSYPDFFRVLQTLGIEVQSEHGMDS